MVDITYIAIDIEFEFLAVVLDASSRRVVGWAMAAHLRTELVLDALDMALRSRRRPRQVIHHSDHRSQLECLRRPVEQLAFQGREEALHHGPLLERYGREMVERRVPAAGILPALEEGVIPKAVYPPPNRRQLRGLPASS